MSLKHHLLRSTAMTPTHHKGGGGIFRAIVAIAAAVAIPIVAPQIAISMGLSAGLVSAGFSATAAGTLGGALVGGALGAGSAFALGQNPIVGAIGGGIGGGIGGYYNANPAATTTQAAGSGAAASTAPSTAGAAPGAASTGAGITTAVPGATGVTAVTPGPGGTFLNTTVPSNITFQTATTAAGGVSPGATIAHLGHPGMGGQVVPAAGLSTHVGSNVPSSFIGPSGTVFYSAPPTTIFAPQGTPTFGQNVSNFFSNVKNRLTDPQFLAEQGVKVGTNLLTNAIVGDTPDMSEY